MLHTLFFSWGSMSSMFQCSIKCFMASCRSLTVTFRHFSLYALFTFIFWTAFFHCLSSYFPNFHLLLHYIILPSHFLGAITRGWFTCFIDANLFFLSIAEHLVTIISPELSVLYLNIFYTHFSMPIFGYMSHTQAY